MKRLGIVAVAVIVLLTMLACSKKPAAPGEADLPKPEPTPLFKPAMSYWNFERTQRELKFSNWDTVEDRRPLVSDRRPPFRVLVIRVPNYKDHGFTGDLVLWFYNDRLMKTQYYVANIKDYLNAAGQDQQIMLGSEGSGGIAPHTRVWMGKDADGKTYIGMQDEILKGQMDDWIVRYSQN